MKEETIAHNLDDAKTPKENRAAYNDTGVKLQNKGKIVDAILLTCRCRQFSILKYSLILLGITYTIESIINKWKKLKQEWSKKWKFFDDLDKICGHWDIFFPSSLFDSSLRDEVDSESVGTDDLGKQYNDCSEFLQVLFISLFSTHFCSVSPLAPIKPSSTKTLEEPSRTMPLFLSTVYKILYIQDIDAANCLHFISNTAVSRDIMTFCHQPKAKFSETALVITLSLFHKWLVRRNGWPPVSIMLIIRWEYDSNSEVDW